MALRRKGSLADLAARLDRARGDLAMVEAALVSAAHERAEAVGRLGDEDLDVAALVERRDAIAAPERELLRQREALQETIAALGARCAALATAEAEAVVGGLRAKLVPLAEERDRIEARLVAIAAEEAEIELEIADAVDAVGWAAAEYDDAARASAEGLRRQEAERVAWYAKQPRSRRNLLLEREPPRLKRLVDEELARLADSEQERRVRSRAASEESLRRAGIDPAELRSEERGDVGESQRFPRLRV